MRRLGQRIGRSAGVRWLLLAAALLAAPAVGGQSVDRLVTDFDIIVFRTEFEPTPEPRIRKWMSAVRVYIDSRAGNADLQRDLTATHMLLLQKLTGLDIAYTKTLADANIVIVFERQKKLIQTVNQYLAEPIGNPAMLKGSLCFGIYASNSHFEITKAVIGIPSDAAPSFGKLPACIIEEFTQVMGLPNDSDEVYPSVFNDHSPDDYLTEQDETLVKLLYNPSLVPGMDRTTALDKVRAILSANQE
jgi:Protein of unknown function (DUF2927)